MHEGLHVPSVCKENYGVWQERQSVLDGPEQVKQEKSQAEHILNEFKYQPNVQLLGF